MKLQVEVFGFTAENIRTLCKLADEINSEVTYKFVYYL
jgi:hypothetical protein